MMKITLFVFAAILLFAVASAMPRPNEPTPTGTNEKLPFDMEEIAKLLQTALAGAKSEMDKVATKENVDKATENIQDIGNKLQEALINLMKQIPVKQEETQTS